MEGAITLIIAFLTDPIVYEPLVYGVFLFSILRLTSDVFRKFRGNKSGFGTVFDSVTGKPIDLARIRLVDVHGLTIASAVTDAYGHYRLTAQPGEYTVDVTKTAYTFPSRFLKNYNYSKTYDNVLPSSRIRVKDYGIITKNVPIDNIRSAKKRSRVFRKWIALSENTQLLITYVAPLIVWAWPYVAPPSIIEWMLYLLFVSGIAYRITHFIPSKPPFGTITDERTGVPLEKVIIRLFEAKFNKLEQTQITSKKGRYAMLVNRGSYYMTMQKDGYRKVRLNYPHITADSYPLATNVQMKRNDRP